ncbi:hypothetical protein [Vibrio genomosp. F10]|uniref:hypothetical protein n=1 Tax=Vibrio genomosp. F10 TaxID=723171 RepID=UPI00037F88C7|nr:hypothetical protein [Vibrio genomosp. F10]OEF09419.1 hypothetical protein A1QI_14620 [Vibrio genomosp. F10 str. 9ZB36]
MAHIFRPNQWMFFWLLLVVVTILLANDQWSRFQQISHSLMSSPALPTTVSSVDRTILTADSMPPTAETMHGSESKPEKLQIVSVLSAHNQIALSSFQETDVPTGNHCPDTEKPHQHKKNNSNDSCGSVCQFKIPTYVSCAVLASQTQSLALIEPDQSVTANYRATTLYRPPIHSFLT